MEAFFESLSPVQKKQFLNGPALTPPPGVIPNFKDPPNRTSLCIGVTIATTILATLVVGLRLYTKLFCVRKMRVEDYLTIASLAVYAGFIYICLRSYVSPGGFVHLWDIRVKDVPVLMKDINVASILNGVAMPLLKVAILLDWIHLFVPKGTTKRDFYYFCVANIVMTILCYTILVFVEIFACSPREKIWNAFIRGKCLIDLHVIFVASSVFNFALDLVMLGMPHTIIWRLEVPVKKKLAISVIFALGILACVCGALRIVYSIPWMNENDKSYYGTPFALSAIGEMTAGFLVLCIPSFPRLVKSSPRLQRIFYSTKGMSNSSYQLQSWTKDGSERYNSDRRPEDHQYLARNAA